MNDLENRLSELLKTSVADPPSRVTVQAVRRQRDRRRVMTAVTAVTAIALLAGVSASLLPRLSSAGPAGGRAPAAIPRYYVTESSQIPSGTVVRATATGRVTATVHCPWRGALSEIYPIAAASDQRFFMVCTADTHTAATQKRIYQFRVTSSGQVRDYALIPGGQLGNVTVGPMAVASDGSSVAVVVAPPGTAPATTTEARILVINTRSGAHATWRNASAGSRASRFRIFDVSFTADGHKLVFLGTEVCGSRNYDGDCKPRDQQVRALSPVSGGGLLSAGQKLLDAVEPGTARWITHAVITSDGSTLTLVTVNVPARPQPSTVTVSQILIGTRGQHIIYQVHGSTGLQPEAVLNADASGRRFLITVGPENDPANGWIRDGKLVRLEPPGSQLFWEAW